MLLNGVFEYEPAETRRWSRSSGANTTMDKVFTRPILVSCVQRNILAGCVTVAREHKGGRMHPIGGGEFHPMTMRVVVVQLLL